ncbi:MAG: cysteine synthase A, partial [Solirubrobacterales bacterium]
MAAIATNIVELMGDTPLVQLTRLSEGLPGTVAVKLEAFNPAGSVKDRIGVSMIEAAEKAGRIEPGKTTIVEATSGNTGIALAFVAAARGYELILVLPEGMSRERQGLLKLYGAKVEIVESMGGMGEAVDAARKLARSDEYFLPDQFSNEANPDVHRRTTAEEIWAATDGKVDVFVAGVGTGGTITGVGERLKERKAGVKVIAVEPAASPVLSGGAVGPHRIQGIGAGFVPPVLNRGVLDEIVPIEDDDAVETARAVTQKEGISCGISGGAAVRAALD